MRYLKTYKLFESSEFFDKDYIDELLDKISDSGIDSLSNIEKNRLKLFSEDDKEVIETIERMGDITNKFKDLNQKMRDIQSNGGDPYYLMEDWMKLNDELRPLEASFRKWGIELGDPRLDRLMRKTRPDAYNNIFESVIFESEFKSKSQLKRELWHKNNPTPTGRIISIEELPDFGISDSKFESNQYKGYLSDEENKCLKSIYIFVRNILLDFKKQISIFYQKNPGQLSISDFIKNHYKYPDKVIKSNDPNSFIIKFDEINPLIRKTFKSLQEEFIIYIIPKSEDAGIKSLTDPLRIKGLEIGTTKLFNHSEESFKSSLQHEIQHIANIEKEGIEKGDFDSGYIYLSSKKETDSHAKQFAYLYKKNYPEETAISLKKLQEMNIVKKSKEKLNLYLWFMSPEEFRKIKGNENMTEEDLEMIKKSGQDFREKLKYYFELYNK